MKPEDCTTDSRRNSSAGKKLATGSTSHGLLDPPMESEQANVKTPLKSFHPQFDVKVKSYMYIEWHTSAASVFE